MIVSTKLFAIDSKKAHYAISVAMKWEGQNPPYGFINPLGLGDTYIGIKDTVNLLQVQSAVSLPVVKTVRGVIQWNQDEGDLTLQEATAPLLIQASDTGDTISICKNGNEGGILAGAAGSYIAGTPISGINGPGWFHFCAPIVTKGTSFDLYRAIPGHGISSIRGYANLQFLTYDLPPYQFS